MADLSSQQIDRLVDEIAQRVADDLIRGIRYGRLGGVETLANRIADRIADRVSQAMVNDAAFRAVLLASAEARAQKEKRDAR